MAVRYDFRCPECFYTVEVSSDENQPECYDHIRAVPMKKVYQISGIVFKGSGFYRTDNK